MKIKSVIFDVEGILISTKEYHFKAWKKVFDDEAIDFEKKDAKKIYGLSRLEALEKILEKTNRFYDLEEKFSLTEKKNDIYKELLGGLTKKDVLPGVFNALHDLKKMGLKVCAESSSRNARLMLENTGLLSEFDAAVDGTEIKEPKPNPEIFLLAAQKLKLPPSSCIAVVDDQKSIDAAEKALMITILKDTKNCESRADFTIKSLSELGSLIHTLQNDE